jgi:DNA-binding winged helix-turn-helix (wHTH) protein
MPYFQNSQHALPGTVNDENGASSPPSNSPQRGENQASTPLGRLRGGLFSKQEVIVYKEANFSPDYRQAQVGQIMGALYRLRSIAITGLSGMGKSNVVRFIVSHPQVRSRYLQERADDYAFLHVDCAGLAADDEAEIWSEITAQLHETGLSPEVSSQPSVARSVRRRLKRQLLNVKPELNLVLFLDYFDQATAQLDSRFFNYLFHLRNARPRGNLCYVFVTRRPLRQLYELQELLDDGCSVGPLCHQDALDSIRRDETRLGCVFSAAQREQLIACTGGHPGFLKNASELLGSGQVDAALPVDEFAGQLLQAGKIESLCRELWADLTPEEQSVLRNAARGLPVPRSVDRACVVYLETSGLLTRKEGSKDDLRVAVFCPLFEAFVRDVGAEAGAVHIAAVFPNQARIETPAGEEWVTLSPRLFALLLALAEAQGQVVPADDVIAQVYGVEAAGVTNAALSQLVKRLRGLLDPPVRRMTGDTTFTCVETVRDVGYRLEG